MRVFFLRMVSTHVLNLFLSGFQLLMLFVKVFCLYQFIPFIWIILILDPWSLILDPWSLILDPVILDPWSLILDPWSLILDPVIFDPVFLGSPQKAWITSVNVRINNGHIFTMHSLTLTPSPCNVIWISLVLIHVLAVSSTSLTCHDSDLLHRHQLAWNKAQTKLLQGQI